MNAKHLQYIEYVTGKPDGEFKIGEHVKIKQPSADDRTYKVKSIFKDDIDDVVFAVLESWPFDLIQTVSDLEALRQ